MALINFVIYSIYTVILSFHPFYISLTEVEFDEKSRSLQVSVRIFADDLEEALTNRGVSNIDLLSKANDYNHALDQYFGEELLFTVNGKRYDLELIGVEVEDDALWTYLEIKNVRKIKSLEIQNEILIQEHKGQQNILKLLIGSEKEVYRLNSDKTNIVYESK